MSTRFTKDDGYLESDMLHFGYDHIDTALTLIKNSNPACYDSAGYLLQLGFELILKAWHLHEFAFFKDNHDLNNLITKLRQHKCKIEFSVEQRIIINEIDNFYNLRYPRRAIGDTIEIGSDQIVKFEDLLETLWQMLPSELIESYESLDRTKKDGRVLMRKKIEK